MRVLDGTGQLDHGVGRGADPGRGRRQIDGIGNAANFKFPTTQFIITGSKQQAEAEKLQAALGVGEVVQSADSSDSVDITVILGADALARPAQGHLLHRQRRMSPALRPVTRPRPGDPAGPRPRPRCGHRSP